MSKKLLILLLLLVMPGLVYCPKRGKDAAAKDAANLGDEAGQEDLGREEEKDDEARRRGNGGAMVTAAHVPWAPVVREGGGGAGLLRLNPLVSGVVDGLMAGLEDQPALRKVAALTVHGVHADGVTHGEMKAMAAHIDDLTAVRRDFDKLRGEVEKGFSARDREVSAGLEAQTRAAEALGLRVDGVVREAAERASADGERRRELEAIRGAMRAIEDALGLVKGPGEGEEAYRARIARMRRVLSGDYVSREVYDAAVARLEARLDRQENPNGFVAIMDLLASLSLRYGRFDEVRGATPPQLLVAFAALEAVRRWGPKGLSFVFPPLALAKFPCQVYAGALETVVAAALCANAGGYAAGIVGAPFQGARRFFGRLRRGGGAADPAGQV